MLKELFEAWKATGFKAYKLKKADKVLFQKHEAKLYTLKEKHDNAIAKKEMKVKAKEFNMSLKKYLELQDKALQILRLFSSNYSMGDYRVLYINGKVFKTLDYTSMYAKSCKWEAVHGRIELKLTKSELQKIEIIGGMPTIKIKEVHPKVWACKQLESKYYRKDNTPMWKEGFITSDYHTTTLVEAIKYRKEQAQRLILQRKSELKLKTVFVGLKHSLMVGNCQSGTIAFAQRHNLDVDMGYRLDFILNLENTIYTNRLRYYAG